MTTALAGGFARTTDVLGTVVADIATDTSIVTAATGFTLSAASARTVLSGKLIFLEIFITRSGADVTQTNTNVADLLVCTIDAAYRPDQTINAVCGNGSTVGEVAIGTDGTVTLRSLSYTLVSGTNLRITTMFLNA
jgi:hypothetical protein